MARKSRKHLVDVEPEKIKKPYDFIAGGYLRVSANDSDSIESQKMIIQSYVERNPDIFLEKFYIDDGKSSFVPNRPAFINMISDIENKIINCVIVKDISRFGRDDLETAAYIQKFFPLHGAKFIAITDNHDSHSDAENLDSSFFLKNLINYAYSKDISKKVKSVVKLKQEQGEYIGAALPYGYKKQRIDGMTHYAIDETAAAVVRNIFSWAVQGNTGYTIASRLNSQNILSPGVYRKQGLPDTEHQGIWTRITVISILRNQAYTGSLIMGKTRTRPMQMRKPERVAKGDWIVVADHHEPIIEQELFQDVQRILDSRSKQPDSEKRAPDTNAYLGNNLFCGDCGRKMKRRHVNGNTYYICPRYTEAKDACTAKRISEASLADDIFDSILLEIEKVGAYREKQLEYEQSLAFKIKNNNLQKRSVRLANELESLDGTMRERYEVMVQGMISGSDFLLMKDYINGLQKLMRIELHEMQAEVGHYQKNVSSDCARVNEFLKYADADELTEDMYAALVDKILVRNVGVEVRLYIYRRRYCQSM